ncbi:MAG: hypothetical protein ACI8TP_000646 [Acidimicrobiales bacterium]|jgi:hypothetical protein
MYRTLLGRPPDRDGLAYWPNRLNNTDDIVLTIQLATSSEYQSLRR